MYDFVKILLSRKYYWYINNPTTSNGNSTWVAISWTEGTDSNNKIQSSVNCSSLTLRLRLVALTFAAINMKVITKRLSNFVCSFLFIILSNIFFVFKRKNRKYFCCSISLKRWNTVANLFAIILSPKLDYSYNVFILFAQTVERALESHGRIAI